VFFESDVLFKSNFFRQISLTIIAFIFGFRLNECQVGKYNWNWLNYAGFEWTFSSASTYRGNEGFSLFEILNPKRKETYEGRLIYGNL